MTGSNMQDWMYKRLSLQLFSDGASAGSGQAAAGADGTSTDGTSTGVKDNVPAAGAQNEEPAKAGAGATGTGHAQDAATATDAAGKSGGNKPDTLTAEERRAAYDEFIKANKDLDDARISRVVQRRLRSSQAKAQMYEDMSPLVDALAAKYGKDATDIAGILEAYNADSSGIEERAAENGRTVEDQKKIEALEAKVKAMDRQREESKKDRQYAEWMEASEELAKVYPSFDMEAERKNPKFIGYLSAGLSVRDAYELTHRDEIFTAASRAGADEATRRMQATLATNKQRPAEGGMSGRAAAAVSVDISKSTPEQRAEIRRRVMRGEVMDEKAMLEIINRTK